MYDKFDLMVVYLWGLYFEVRARARFSCVWFGFSCKNINSWYRAHTNTHFNPCGNESEYDQQCLNKDVTLDWKKKQCALCMPKKRPNQIAFNEQWGKQFQIAHISMTTWRKRKLKRIEQSLDLKIIGLSLSIISKSLFLARTTPLPFAQRLQFRWLHLLPSTKTNLI